MYNFSSSEKEVSEFWKTSNSFLESNKMRPDKSFVFYDGPPFATGTPHYGHILVGVIKDVVARYKNMQGYNVPRQWGWDCHGVPIESLVQNKLGMTRVDIVKNDLVKVFNDECRDSVFTCADQWKETIDRIGRWVDFDHPYKTMDIKYMESVWWCFKQIFDQGRVYLSNRIMPYSCKLQTALSNFEVNDSYRNVEDPYCIAKFLTSKGFYVLVYTTTPWTLPSNAAICLNPDAVYVVVEDQTNKEQYLIASNLVDKVMGQRPYTELERMHGRCYAGIEYHSLFGDKTFRIVTDNYVTSEDGTGAVHIAPLFGEDDYRVGKDWDLWMSDPLDAEGKFTSLYPEYEGVFCKDADEKIVADLKAQNKVFKYGKIKHDYPFCYRTGTPLIYRAVDAWYIKLDDIKDRLVKNNNEVKWTPENIGSGRFANWLNEARDWNISRSRLWGSCIPIWKSEDGEMVCVGSIKELEDLSGVKVTDLHKDFLDGISFQKDGKVFTRVPDVLDCWFESGCMPYAQSHYPFENKESTESNFPADFIVEGLDQTRGWFYTLLVVSTLLFDKAPYKNVMVNGLVLAEDGTKMSKSKNNFTSPTIILDKYGADALRAYFSSSAALHAEPLVFNEKSLQTTNRSLLMPFINAFDFYKLYSGIDNWKYAAEDQSVSTRELDVWITAELDVLIEESTKVMEAYDFSKVLPKVEIFLDKLCNWYIRLSRKLFWQDTMSQEKHDAYNTLHNVLLQLSRLLAPFVPFVTEHVFRSLGNSGSVHWQNYPKASGEDKSALIAKMDTLRSLATLGHNVRKNNSIRVRQPLSKLMVLGCNKDYLSNKDKDLLKSELNVKEVEVLDESQAVSFTAKANFKRLGKVCGKDMQNVAQVIAQLSSAEISQLKQTPLNILGFNISIDDVLVTQNSSNSQFTDQSNGLTVILDATLTPELINEGEFRELCSFLQALRKTNGFEVSDRVAVHFNADNKGLISLYSEELKKQILAKEVVFSDTIQTNEIVLPTNGRFCFQIMKV